MKNSSNYTRILVALLILLPLSVAIAEPEENEEAEVLAWINGEMITSDDLDALILTSHQGRDMSSMQSMELPNFLKKAVNDRLLVQDAQAMGMDEEPSVQRVANEFLDSEAMRAFVNARFNRPKDADTQAMRIYFEKYYWRIHLRQISTRTRETADSLRHEVSAGADMDSLARTRSLDSHNIRGGLHSLKYWGDVENVLRDAVLDIDEGELSEIFPFREAYAFLRVEKIDDLNEEAYEDASPSIERIILNGQRERAWQAFLDSLDTETPVRMVESTLNSIRDDEAIVFMGDFLRAQPEPAMSLEAMPVLSGTELRREISHTAMIDGTAPFDSILDRSVAAKRQMILLRHHAEAGGFYNNEELLSQRQRRLEQALVEAYLQEMIVPRIVFNRQEFQSYYEENEDLFRGPDQVRMDMVVVDDKDSADEMSLRLSEGADFDFLRSQYLGDDADANGSVRWVSEGVFSGSIQEELRSLESGECSKPMDSRGRWLIVKLLGRRKGAARPLAEVEMQIREIMFQRKFTELLDEHIALLKERSEIRMNQEAIDEYFGQGS